MLSTTIASTYAFSAPTVGDEAPANSAEVIKAVNGANATWTSGVNERFAGFTLGDMRMLMGAKPEDMSKLPKMEPYDAATLAAVPASYDPRTSQKACTGPVLDQGFCGSCWAFGATEAISDRLCLSKGAGASFVQLAPLDLTTCDSGVFKMEDGCQGGQLSGAWDYAKKTGLVEESCYPYLQSQGGPVPTCEPTAQPCLPESKFIKTPKCAISSTCEATKHKLSSVYSVDVAQLKAELVNKGPVESAFTVYADFPTYKSGVYKHTTGSALGGHAIKIIGFGTEDNSDYCMPHALARPLDSQIEPASCCSASACSATHAFAPPRRSRARAELVDDHVGRRRLLQDRRRRRRVRHREPAHRGHLLIWDSPPPTDQPAVFSPKVPSFFIVWQALVRMGD